MDAVRRRLLRSLGATAAALWLAPPAARAAARSERRFVFVIQRGAADGLNTVIPYADPAYARQRGALAIAAADAHRLDGLFALHPALEQTARMAAAGQALGVQAVATPTASACTSTARTCWSRARARPTRWPTAG